jgi:glycosyltransferase involved in cell wall biosynthesis
VTKKKRIVCFGPGPKFKGGISNYNTALAKALDKRGNIEVYIVSWTNQYPSIIPREFVDKSSKQDFLEGTSIQVTYLTDYNKPWTWTTTSKYIVDLNPDIVIFQWAIAIQGLPMGKIAKKIAKNSDAEIIFDLHFVIQKEGSKLDNRLTRMGIKNADTYIAHAYKTVDELKELFPNRSFTVNEDGKRAESTTVIKLFHPIYDLFQPDPSFDVGAFKQQHNLAKHVFLFFGFIRKYKGLHNAIKAFKIVSDKRDDVSLLICGESFWQTLDTKKLSTKIKKALFGLAKTLFLSKKEDENEYRPLELINELNLGDRTMVVNKFVANEEVHKYFQVADAVVLFYDYATPSGIESLSYNFKKPLLATRVGHFPETIEDGFNGYLAEADNIQDMAAQMLKYLDLPLFPENVEIKTRDLSWENYATAILNEHIE